MKKTTTNFTCRAIRVLTIAVFMAGILVTSIAESRAGFINVFSGSSKPKSGGNAQIAVEFAVLDRFTGASSAGDKFGTGFANFDTAFAAGGGSAPFDTNARYLYLFQNIIPTTSSSAFSGFSLIVPSSVSPFPNFTSLNKVSSFGQWALYLTDNSGIVTTSNDFGLDGNPFVASANAFTGVTNPSVSNNGGNVASLAAISGFTITPTSFQTAFAGNNSPTTTALWGFTSYAQPQWTSAASTFGFAGGTTPVPIPEPSTEVLMAMGAVALVAFRSRKRLLKRTTAAPV